MIGWFCANDRGITIRLSRPDCLNLTNSAADLSNRIATLFFEERSAPMACVLSRGDTRLATSVKLCGNDDHYRFLGKLALLTDFRRVQSKGSTARKRRCFDTCCQSPVDGPISQVTDDDLRLSQRNSLHCGSQPW